VSPPANADIITADFQTQLVGDFMTQYEEAGMVFTSDGGAGLSFLINLITFDIGIFEATAGGPIGVDVAMPTLAESVTVSFFLAQDDVVTLRAFDDRGFVLDTAIAPGPPSSNEYLTLTVDTSDFAIARISWIGSSDTILCAGEVSASVVPAPSALATFIAAALAVPMRRRSHPARN
jgi:hypothetical protein